jgi:hypothetical protein
MPTDGLEVRHVHTQALEASAESPTCPRTLQSACSPLRGDPGSGFLRLPAPYTTDVRCGPKRADDRRQLKLPVALPQLTRHRAGGV